MSSRRVPGRFPVAGTSPIADLIRQRRGARGLTPLDGTLLHAPPIAEGWNALLGAVRTKGKLPGDLREAMILRVAALNSAAFEWIHHEHVGRDAGLSTPQLRAIRDISIPVAHSSGALPESGVLSALHNAALAFTDASTKQVTVPDEDFSRLRDQLSALAVEGAEQSKEDQADDLVAEAAAVVATYNMVSRFLMSMDVAGMSDNEVPWPVDTQEHRVELRESTPTSPQSLHVVTHKAHDSFPWVLLINSLLTNHTMWDLALPYLCKSYNVILYDQRGHGKSTVPSPPTTNLGMLSSDVATILKSLDIPTPIHSVIGVSQGGATALNVGRLYASQSLAKSIVACDTQAIGPQANVKAWDDRIALANASEDGMYKLAVATVDRWFPSGLNKNAHQHVCNMISDTDIKGFEAGARALQGYDLVREPGETEGGGPGLFETEAYPVLLVAGEEDGAGKLAEGLVKLRDEWNIAGGKVEFLGIQKSGHLPMVDQPRAIAEGLLRFLESV